MQTKNKPYLAFHLLNSEIFRWKLKKLTTMRSKRRKGIEAYLGMAKCGEFRSRWWFCAVSGYDLNFA